MGETARQMRSKSERIDDDGEGRRREKQKQGGGGGVVVGWGVVALGVLLLLFIEKGKGEKFRESSQTALTRIST